MKTGIRYEIGDGVFYQVEMSLGQTATFFERLGDVSWSFTSHIGLLALGIRKVAEIAAIVLIPQGMDQETFERRLDLPGFLDEQVAYMRKHLGKVKGLRVIKDFLSCNDLPSMIREVSEIANLITLAMTSLVDNSTASAPSSAAGIPPNGTQSGA